MRKINKTHTFIALIAFSSPLVAHADEPTQVQLTPGQVACLTQKDVADYQKFAKTAPAFAHDLMSRAACYQVKETTPAIIRGTQGSGANSFTEYQLLSGHRVWLANGR